MEGEDPDDYEGEIEEVPDDYMEEDKKKVKKPKKMLGKLRKMGKISVGPAIKTSNSATTSRVKTMEKKGEEEEDLSRVKKIEEKEAHGDSEEDISIKQQVGEALAPGSKGNDETEEDKKESNSIVDGKKNEIGDDVQASNEKLTINPTLLSQSTTEFKSAVQKLDNFKIMKKRYVQDYLDTNHAGQHVDEITRKQVEDFIEGDMMEQLREPSSDLLEMLLHYDPKDLPGERSGEDEGKENNAIENDKEGDTDLKIDKGKQPANLGQDKEAPSFVSNDTLSKGTVSSDGHNVEDKTMDSEKAHMNSSTSKAVTTESRTVVNKESRTVVNKESRAETDLQFKEKTLAEGAENAGQPTVADPSDSDSEHGDVKGIELKEEKQDFTQHPNFPALRKKYVESYLNTHYKGEEVSPHIKLMVENLISSDLVQQLRTDKVVREELFHLIPNADSEGAVKLEKGIIEETQTYLPALEKPLDTIEAAMSISAQNDNIKMTASSDNVIHSSAIISNIQEELTEADVDKSISTDTPKEQYTSRMENETGTEPIPPAGGKDNQRLITEEAIGERVEEGSEERIAEKDELRSDDGNSLKNEDDEASENDSRDIIKNEIKEEQVDTKKEGLDHNEEDKATNEEDGDSNFSFKTLGNVLKDRFQALAKQIIATDEEKKTSQGDEDSKSSETFDDSKHSEYIGHESLQEPNIVKNENSPELIKEANKEITKVSPASLVGEEELKVENVVPEFTEKQETSEFLSSDAKEEIIKNNGQSNETVHSENQVGDLSVVQDSESKEELRKSIDVTKDNKVEQDSNTVSHRIDLVSLTTTVPTSGSHPAKGSGMLT